MQRVLAPTAAPGTVHPNDLCISTGCGAILDNLFLTITAPGDGVLIPAPYYPAFDNDLRVRNGTKVGRGGGVVDSQAPRRAVWSW
jgi:1-aminocyclopropane-1-carboxylate synthase